MGDNDKVYIRNVFTNSDIKCAIIFYDSVRKYRHMFDLVVIAIIIIVGTMILAMYK